MVKIVSRKSLGIQAVYDIGVEKDHNFLLKNGIFAANCFNKSHSTAYAYVTYQTAYLKANYPVEYMTALLTASSDKKEKIEKYRENCQKMGIEVEPPNINRSLKEFTPDKTKILFGLSAVPNLGHTAIENIIQARAKAEGKFKSLADFCEQVDLRIVNTRALETLILVGAFDSIQSNRKQLINDLELTIAWAQNRAKEKESGQMNLFDLMGNSGSESKKKDKTFKQAPSSPAVADYSLQEKLKLEKETVGFYISAHPLQSIDRVSQILSPINLGQLSEWKGGKKRVSAVVMLTAIKRIVTKKGDSMAFIQIEDVSGQVDGVVFPSIYESIENVLQEDARLIVWGKVDKKEDKIQLIIEDVEPVETVKMLMLRITPQQAQDRSSQNSLKSILQENAGDKNKAKIPVIAMIGNGDIKQFVRLGEKFWVQNENLAIESLANAGFSAYIEPMLPSS